jgi:nucleotide-binding universal stress UspA family protein
MFKKVLAVTDFSDHGRRLLECISGIQGISEMVLLHVIKDTTVPMGTETVERFVRESAEKSFQKEMEYIETACPDIRVTPELISSPDIADAIIGTGEKHGVDLIAISAHAIGLTTGLLTKNVATSVLCHPSRINILVMRHKIIETLTSKKYEKFCPMLFSRILIPTDLSGSGNATALAGTMKGVGEIILLHVISKRETWSGEPDSFSKAETRLGEIRDSIVAQGVPSRVLVRTGELSDEITKAAEDEDVSVIWLRSNAKGCIHELFLGSRVHDVVMNTKRPVIVIRSAE